jgi:gentisate 1,2-dioxygenase
VSATTALRQEFYGRLDQRHMTPLWESLHALVTPEPTAPLTAAKWDYDNEIKPLMLEAGGLITAREAERRVLVLENPGLRGQSSITRTLFAGVQMIVPGEIAPAHRHTQSALRFILEGKGAYTAVDGERTTMSPGDFVTTPSWSWHDHGNETNEPMMWLDILDIPLVRFLSVSFQQASNLESHQINRPEGDAAARYANNLFPVDWKPTSKNAPIFNYPYTRSRESLDALSRNGEPDPCHGFKLRYINPANGGPPLPTIGTFIQLIPKEFSTIPYRCTDATVFTVVEGTGESRIGDTVIRWKPRDVFVAPGWLWQSHSASSDAVIFSASDRPVQDALGLWREQRGNAAA